MYTIQRILEFDAAHRVYGHEGKCAHLHGHRYKIVLHFKGELDSLGRVVDFGVIKTLVGNWLNDEIDHGVILSLDDPLLPELRLLREDSPKIWTIPFPATAEGIARAICRMMPTITKDSVDLIRVDVWETPNCCGSFIPTETSK